MHFMSSPRSARCRRSVDQGRTEGQPTPGSTPEAVLKGSKGRRVRGQRGRHSREFRNIRPDATAVGTTIFQPNSALCAPRSVMRHECHVIFSWGSASILKFMSTAVKFSLLRKSSNFIRVDLVDARVSPIGQICLSIQRRHS